MASFPSIPDLIKQAQSGSQPPASGPQLAYEIEIREDSQAEFALGQHSNTQSTQNGLELVSGTSDGTREAFWFIGVRVPPVFRVEKTYIEWTATGVVQVFVSQDGTNWVEVQNGDPVPWFSVGDTFFARPIWVRQVLKAGTAPVLSLFQLRVILSEPDTSVLPPWPTHPDVAAWIWRQATPEYWTELLGGEDNLPSTVTYRYFEAVLNGIIWGRLLLDRAAVRIDPKQALTEDLDRLADWANSDKRITAALPDALRRSYISNARVIARYRGSKLLEKVFEDIFGIGTLIEWRPDKNPDGSYVYPHRRVVTIAGPINFFAVKTLMRRSFPASVEIELHYQNAAPPITGFAYTGFDSSAIGEPPGTYYDYGWTLAEDETVTIV